MINQELNRAGVGVIRGLRHADRNLAHPAPHVGVDDRRRRFFQHFLMTPLQRALAFAKVDRVAVLVGEHLHLDVPRIDDRLLDVHFAVAESALRLAPGRFQGRFKFLREHAPAASLYHPRPRLPST